MQLTITLNVQEKYAKNLDRLLSDLKSAWPEIISIENKNTQVLKFWKIVGNSSKGAFLIEIIKQQLFKRGVTILDHGYTSKEMTDFLNLQYKMKRNRC